MKQVGATAHSLNSTRVIATTIGVLFGLCSSVNHGFFEILQGSTPTGGVLIQAIGESQRFWPLGTEDAFTLIPNFMATGIVSILVGLAIVTWTIWFLPGKHGPSVFLGLFVLSFLVGGGMGQVAFFIPAWAFATRMDKPLNWPGKAIPHRIRPLLSRSWVAALILATIASLIGVEMAIFGFFPGTTVPESVQNISLLFMLSAAILYVVAFLLGSGYEFHSRELGARIALQASR